MADTAGLSTTPIISIDSDDDGEDSDLEMMITSSSSSVPKKPYSLWQHNTNVKDEDDIIFLDAALPVVAPPPKTTSCPGNLSLSNINNNGPLDLSVVSSQSDDLRSSSDGDDDEDSDGTSSESESKEGSPASQSLLSKKSWDNILGPTESWEPLLTDRTTTPSEQKQLLDTEPVSELDPPECLPNSTEKQDCGESKPEAISLEHVERKASEDSPIIRCDTSSNREEPTTTPAHIINSALCDRTEDARVLCPITQEDMDAMEPSRTEIKVSEQISVSLTAATTTTITATTTTASHDEEDSSSDESESEFSSSATSSDDDNDDVISGVDTEADDKMAQSVAEETQSSGLTKADWGSGACLFASSTSSSTSSSAINKTTADKQSTSESTVAKVTKEKEHHALVSDFSVDRLLATDSCRSVPETTPDSDQSCSNCDQKTESNPDVSSSTPYEQSKSSGVTVTVSPESTTTVLSADQSTSKLPPDDRKNGDFYRGDLIMKIKTKRRYSMKKAFKEWDKRLKRKAKTELDQLLSCAKASVQPTGATCHEEEDDDDDDDDNDDCVTILDSDSDDGDSDDIIFIKRTRKRHDNSKAVDLSSGAKNSASTTTQSEASGGTVALATDTSSSSNVFPSAPSSMDWILPLPPFDPLPLSCLNSLAFSSSSSSQGAADPTTTTSLSGGDKTTSSYTAGAGTSSSTSTTTSNTSGDIWSTSDSSTSTTSTTIKPPFRRSASVVSSLSSNTDRSATIPFKKRRFSSTTLSLSSGASGAQKSAKPTNDTDSDAASKPPVNSYSCYNCGSGLGYSTGSTCLEGHRCCDMCLQARVKHILTKSRKGSLRCGVSGCSSYYTLSELRQSLPPMVVDILEDKLDTEYMHYATQIALSSGLDDGEVVISDSEEVTSEDDPVPQAEVPLPPAEKNALSLPDHWLPMLEDQDYQTVRLDPEDQEYISLMHMFFRTMLTPRANIISIKRVQNPILWQFYQVKKSQMSKEHCGPVKEMQLFHGTKKSLGDAICRSNFDWRLSGTNGTMYGQGSYFAEDASYSHKFTDPPPRCAHGSRLGSIISSVISMNGVVPTLPPSFGNLSNAGAITTVTPSPFALLTPSSWTSGQGLFHQPLDMTTDVSNAATTSQSAGATEPLYNVPVAGWQSESAINPSLGHTHIMFVAKVLVGLYAQGRHNFRKPPALDPRSPYGRCYDTCVNDMCDPKIFVIFDSAQCFPEYIVEFQNRPPNYLS